VVAGHAARGTTRRRAGLADIEASGAEAQLADPERLATVMAQLAGVSAICWLLGSVDPVAAPRLHGPRLRTLMERLVDTPVRGLVYEGVGSVAPTLLTEGAKTVREAARTWRIPVVVTATDPSEHDTWLAEMRMAVADLLSGGC
jgi:hypothetical protein